MKIREIWNNEGDCIKWEKLVSGEKYGIWREIGRIWEIERFRKLVGSKEKFEKTFIEVQIRLTKGIKTTRNQQKQGFKKDNLEIKYSKGKYSGPRYKRQDFKTTEFFTFFHVN